jgi:hypothetical protein
VVRGTPLPLPNQKRPSDYQTHRNVSTPVPHTQRQNNGVCKGIWGYKELAWQASKQLTQTRVELEILMVYNAEVRGFLGYYALADNLVEVADKVLWLTSSSFFRTLAGKRQSSVKKVAKSLKRGAGRYVLSLQREGKPTKEYELVSSTRQLKHGGSTTRLLDLKPNTWVYRNRTELGKRLLAHQCEWCETRQGQIEVHHVRKLGNLKGKVSWERQMIQRHRKTMILCAECHDELHAGTLSEKKKRRGNGRAVYPERGMGGSEGSSVKPDVAIR